MKTKFSYKTLAAAVVSGCLMFSPAAVADGIPTVDWVAVQKATEQIRHQVEQIARLKEQIQALKGLRDVGQIAQEVFKQDIPNELRNLYKQAGINVNNAHTGNNYAKTQQANKDALTAQINNLDRFMANNNKRLSEIKRLSDLARNAADLKAAADIRNQISTYTTQLQHQQIEIENAERLYRMQRQVEQKQRMALEACQIKHISSGKFDACN